MGCEVRRGPATVEVPFIPRPRLPLVGGISRTRCGWSHAPRLSSIARLAIWLYLGCKHHFISSIIGFQKGATKMQEGSLNIFNHLFRAGKYEVRIGTAPVLGRICLVVCLPACSVSRLLEEPARVKTKAMWHDGMQVPCLNPPVNRSSRKQTAWWWSVWLYW